MPQDPNLYGQRVPKKQKRDANLSSSLDFTAQLTSLISNAPSTTGRPRPSKTKTRQDKPSSQHDDHVPGSKGKLALKTTRSEEEAEQQARAQRRLEDKARLYAAMKRGDYVAKEGEAAPLVDFDRKWADRHGDDGYASSTSSSSDGQDERDDDEIIEYEDEFGRLRQTTRAEKERMERRQRRGLLGAEELERMSARPAAPAQLIHGDAIQSMAFAADDPDKMAELARKRDRSATPPEARHYNADAEVRTKGTGFYKFSKDEETRQREMDSLGEERRATEALRQEREEKVRARKREIERRRRDMADRRAQRQADSFLDGLTDP